MHFLGYCEVMRLVEVVVGIGGGGLKPTLQFTVSDGIFYFGVCFFVPACLSPASAIPFRLAAHACREAVGASAHPAAKP